MCGAKGSKAPFQPHDNRPATGLDEARGRAKDRLRQERQFLEDTAAKVHVAFIKAVAEGRNIPEEKVRSFADGRVLLGSEAKALGLVDGFGDVYDAGREALKLAKIDLKPEEVPNLIFVNQKKGFLQKALEGSASLPSMIEAARIPTLKYLAQ